MKRKREKPKCGYCKGSHYEKSCFRKKMVIMTKLLEENNIDFRILQEEKAISLWNKKMVSGGMVWVLG